MQQDTMRCIPQKGIVYDGTEEMMDVLIIFEEAHYIEVVACVFCGLNHLA